MGLQLEFHISQTVPIRNTCTYDEYVLCIQIFHDNSEIIPPCSINKIALNKRSLNTYAPYLPDSYSLGGILCKGDFGRPGKEVWGIFGRAGKVDLKQPRPPILGRCAAQFTKMGEKSTPADPPKLCRIRLLHAGVNK